MIGSHTSAAVLILVLIGAPAAAADNTLATARDLYAAAAYEDALAVLDLLKQREHGPDEERAIQQYRAFCLLALGRTADAERAIEAIVAAQPGYQPSDTEVSPRVRATFTEVRRRVLPAIVHELYAAAKSAYDRKEYADAVERFTRVLEVLGDPDLRSAAMQPPLSDLSVLAAGFRDLSVSAAAPPPPPPPPEPPPPVAAAPVQPGPPRVYTSADPDVVPPGIITQTLPPFPSTAALAMQAQGVIEVVINERGAVEQVVMRVPLNATYDRQAINAARGWRYRPATVGGVPVKFRKSVQIMVRR
jgi:TonB family protein